MLLMCMVPIFFLTCRPTRWCQYHVWLSFLSSKNSFTRLRRLMCLRLGSNKRPSSWQVEWINKLVDHSPLELHGRNEHKFQNHEGYYVKNLTSAHGLFFCFSLSKILRVFTSDDILLSITVTRKSLGNRIKIRVRRTARQHSKTWTPPSCLIYISHNALFQACPSRKEEKQSFPRCNKEGYCALTFIDTYSLMICSHY